MAAPAGFTGPTTGEPSPTDPTAYARPATVPFPAANPYAPAKAALGERLFVDTALSGKGDRACASCHEPGITADEYNSGVQEPGQTVSVPFAEPGHDHVYCGIHPKMKLTVEVER